MIRNVNFFFFFSFQKERDEKRERNIIDRSVI